MADDDLLKLKIDKSTGEIKKVTRRRKFILWGGMSAFLLTGAVILYIGGWLGPAISVEVSTVSQVYPSQSFSLLNASGYIVAQRKAAVASKVTGRLVALMVEEGNRIRKGQIIARLENDDVVASKAQSEANLKVSAANLNQAKAELEEATLSHNRNKNLISKSYISQSEFDSSEARYRRTVAAVQAAEAALKASQAAVRGADVALEYTYIRAPFDAVVLTKNADIGDIVTPLGAAANAKAAVVTIADMNSLQVEIDVSETNISLVKVGQPCEINLDALPDTRFRGEVHAIVPTVDRSKATVMVKVKITDKDPRMLPDMSAKVSFLSRSLRPDEQKPRVAVNKLALLSRSNRHAVFVIEGNQVREKNVTTGENLGDMIEIRDGVNPGEKVVMKPPSSLKDGARIKIAEK
ncbi:MAG: efflux RND transporter periplasmic adaptor subunit [Deltaproteobacteria bacterium]|nr:efflux RND transporter periplasmic adaptor subunit [Deltaproteobacteria bacterium]